MNIRYLKEQIEQKLNQPYIEKFIGKPTIDENKLMVLKVLIENKSSLSKSKKEQYIITTMLVQIALDIHEQVPITFEGISTDSKIANQLRVLAGDYYSGLYYFLLAEIDEYDFIHTLASAIKEINENKMKLYHLEDINLEELIELIGHLEGQLIFYVADYVKDTSLNSLASEWLIVNRLMKEKQNAKHKIESTILNKWSHCFGSSSTFINKADTLIEEKAYKIKNLLNECSDQHQSLKNFINDQFNREFNLKTSIVEEG
ncbi:heptaprenyl diphosphate synthase component 1 [Oceanobacillus senegalensis]|uniref:heptaprenyl diphosphate synthase component 1 n=1 Tax=Oceanobacillus senegalensis TaxID=1936063 RepID=UPI001C500FEE|nr:heptaprenyl diphosphate synthase component 1 [Oceanobacillus senegalensis]